MGPQQRKQIVVLNSRRLVISVFGENETNESVTLHRDILGAFSNVFYLLSEKKMVVVLFDFGCEYSIIQS